MNWILTTLRDNPAIAIFITLGLGFWIGKFKYKTFSLGTVTSVLLVGVLIGQLDIPMSGPLKEVSFLLFLFAIGYSVGPQFFRSLKGSGVKQVIFAVIMCVLCFLCTWGVAVLFKYNPGEALGLFSGAQTISAVIGVGADSISSLSASQADKTDWINLIPVCYAVTYIFGTIGSAWILSGLGPAMLGGLKKVKEETKDLEESMENEEEDRDPAEICALREIVYRAFRVDGDWFDAAQTVQQIEDRLLEEGNREFVVRVKTDRGVIDDVTPEMSICKGDEVVIACRRDAVSEKEAWLGPEISDFKLLQFNVEKVPVLVAHKEMNGLSIADLRKEPWMRRVMISSIERGNVELPVLGATRLQTGDMIYIEGKGEFLKEAAKHIGYEDKPTNTTDMVFVGLGIAVGALIGALTLRLGGIPISLSTSGGALIAGLVLGWYRSKRPTIGQIPKSSLWVLNNVGLNLFIAVVGISSGPTFVSGIQQVGWMLFVAGIIATSLPLIIGIFIGDKIFKFPAAINLGCVAGSRTTTAALGAIQDAIGSTVPAMGYTVTYAVGNTLMILMGVVMALLI